MNKTSLDAVLDRLMTVFSVDNDSELARKLHVNRQTLGSWRSRQSIPYSLCVSVSDTVGISLDWLLAGEGPMLRNAPETNPTPALIDPREEAMLELFRSLGEAGKREIQSAAEEKKRLMDIEQRLKDLTEALADTKRPA
ncbi:helix-turn-helix domain-containing protein [Pseudomonas hefeiensis]|uniref:Helix-turn-helix domain-containing protein n=1 Tax=Pseudomonas hefeiensis TaxID=2738125 RepID=A0ABY9GFU3_9PSED|nr:MULTISPECIES: helix-turn-helix domain-containing protein [unclassified Pseudomonas]WLH14482.1 helix-turn-helix domain-containing protein [Pseudomonas sp. FP205]WLH97542.1 helix-turn-helix domain-containing protein [Pseudomonas sp. FP53]WLI41815.1 helix-turn-helix domain-containing protein [Pseudomonas sp. FP821]